MRSSHVQPKVALSHEALRKAADTGLSTSAEPHEVKKALQPLAIKKGRGERHDEHEPCDLTGDSQH